MEEFSDSDRLKIKLSQCLIRMKCVNSEAATIRTVEPHFFKNEIVKKSLLRFVDANARDIVIQSFDIDHMWMYSIVASDSTAVCFGRYVPGVHREAILLKFFDESDLHDFIKGFNECINFKQRDIQDQIERRIHLRIRHIDSQGNDGMEDSEIEDTEFNEYEAKLFLSTKPAPKMNFYVANRPGKMAHYPCRAGAGASVEDYRNFFISHLNDAKKVHWRECPQVIYAPETRQAGDPILDVFDRTFQEQVHQLPRLELPRVAIDSNDPVRQIADDDPEL